MRSRCFLLWAVFACFFVGTLAPACGRADSNDQDTDGDGLPDFQEMHKYRTDPKKKDTAGKGVSDGDWQQRREFNYSVRAVLRVMRPCNLQAINDDYQDVKVLAETKDYVDLEVIAYPFNTNADAIPGNPNWKKDYAAMTEYLAPGVTTNWDESMRKELLRELAKDGIHPEKLTDREVVEQVSRWLFRHCKYRYMFCTFYIGFQDGKPIVLPGLESAFQRELGDKNWTVQQQIEHEVLGREMFNHKCVGTCTSSAVLQTTVLRALGIPTRMILCIPLADASDRTQVAMIEKGLTHHQVKRTTTLGVLAGSGHFTSHTFCEVFVGGRWRRLNYSRLGQNILETGYLGLMIHIHTFNDLTDANLAATWGTRYALGKRDAAFPHNNPYRLLEVSDHFGKHAAVPNPPAQQEHKQLTATRIYWASAKDAPASVRESPPRNILPGSGRFFLHVEEWSDNAGDYLQYKPFLQKVDRQFVLKAKDQPDIKCQLTTGFITLASQQVREFEVLIPPEEYLKMARGVAYTLHPVKTTAEYRWKIKEGLTISREVSAEEKLDQVLERLEKLEKRVEELEKKKGGVPDS